MLARALAASQVMHLKHPLPADSRDYQHILLSGIPILDVRAPVEFTQGSFTQATSLPLMNDEERIAVGTCYKTSGQRAAIALGESLVTGTLKTQRIAGWQAWHRTHPEGYLCCSRGGLRSHIAQQWLIETGTACPLIAGGYKALRRFALEALNRLINLPMLLISGNTGCGKTLLLRTLPAGIDLEGLAQHRGSSFGATLVPQPSQASFENQLAVTMMRKAPGSGEYAEFRWIVEDESASIGSRHIPAVFRQKMAQANIIVIDDPLPRRLARLQDEYFVHMACAFQQHYGEEAGWIRFADYLRHGLTGIQRRLGLEKYTQLHRALEGALIRHRIQGDASAHLLWLEPLLSQYYDPMYRYQLAKKQDRILYRGTFEQVQAWLSEVQSTAHPR